MGYLIFTYEETRPIALMGGIYGNLPALKACLADALGKGAGFLAFLGDITGCNGHSDEAIALVRRFFDAVIAGNHEKQIASGTLKCGCGHKSDGEGKYGFLAHSYALDSLTDEDRRWLAALPEKAILETVQGNILLCHGSPERTNEHLYESVLDNRRLEGWLQKYRATGLVCTHTGLPWVRRLGGSRFAVNCGVVGKSDHDGDPAVHYALLRQNEGAFEVEIRRVSYDHESWAQQLEYEGVDRIFVTPIRTGTWTTGVANLPVWEKERRTNSG